MKLLKRLLRPELKPSAEPGAIRPSISWLTPSQRCQPLEALKPCTARACHWLVAWQGVVNIRRSLLRSV